YCFGVAAEHDTKPTRQQVIEVLEDCRNNYPPTEEEKSVAWYKRIKFNLIGRLGTDFSGLDLSEIDFKRLERGVFTSQADFSNCNMRGISFYGAVLHNCNFTNTDLTNAKFWFCEFQGTDFSHAKLKNTEFSYCNMQNVQFSGLNAGSPFFEGYSFFEAVNFSNAQLRNTNFRGAKFKHHSHFSNADLLGADMRDTVLYGDEFQGANLKNVKFRNTDLRFADFTGANLEGTDFTEANVDGAIFSDVQGIDDTQRKSLESRSGRWWYNLSQNFYNFLKVIYFPAYLLISILIIFFSLFGLLQKDKKTSYFIIAVLSNGFAFFSTFCTFCMIFSGGHPVKQMSQGNYDAWSDWLHFYPFPLFGLMICIFVIGIILLIVFCQLIYRSNKSQHRKLFLYQILTLIHCLLAFNWLLMFMPDA
ncbi:MAG: pentapeptide repeat-containing protein, partial [Planctomycetaceae bacterium]|nr:pentapeptide repeat-containing protein [Planctomycetaceae bacterium]